MRGVTAAITTRRAGPATWSMEIVQGVNRTEMCCAHGLWHEFSKSNFSHRESMDKMDI